MQTLINNLVNPVLGGILLFVLLALLIFSIILVIFFLKKSRDEKAADLANKTLNDEYKELEQVYSDVITEKDQLNIKVDELKQSNDKLKKLAYTDYLTELPNRIAFTEILDSVMLTIRNEEIIAVMDVDLDNFKVINDNLGHSYGDELLIDVTHRLKQAMDENDFLARTGGDEFMILTQNITDLSDYETKIKKIQKIFSYPFVLAMKEYFVTVSIGITLAPKDGKTTQVLMKNADSAMYAAKFSGRNTYYYFNESINEKLMGKIQTQSELRKAIENKEFVIYYQPQIDLTTDKVIGFEALVRWNHPVKGMLSPIDFIPLAEETGLIVIIGKWVLTEACQQLKMWEAAGYQDLSMAVNISARQFKDEDFIDMVHEVIEEIGIKPNQLMLEIPESIAIKDMKFSASIINKLRELGVVFNLDNFGTGNTSMNYLKHVPVNNIKIDKSFLSTMLDDTFDKKIVQFIISLAKTLDIGVIAEGVEMPEQAQFLKKVNCDIAQGYFFKEPVPKELASQLLMDA